MPQTKSTPKIINSEPITQIKNIFIPKGYDPELLYVECGPCGAPVIWEKGKATEIMKQVGIDPLELDSSCLLITDGCPLCGNKGNYTVQIFRISTESEMRHPPYFGNA